MSDWTRDAVVQLEAELASIDRRRGLVAAALDSMRLLSGGGEPRPKPVKAATVARAPRAAAPPRSGPGNPIAARDAAIMKALETGEKNAMQLQAVMPPEPGLTPEQRSDAYRNAMTRLRVKGLIRPTDNGWARR